MLGAREILDGGWPRHRLGFLVRLAHATIVRAPGIDSGASPSMASGLTSEPTRCTAVRLGWQILGDPLRDRADQAALRQPRPDLPMSALRSGVLDRRVLAPNQRKENAVPRGAAQKGTAP
jgi:hypothetical protein